jgi:hypothetical protein
LFYALVIRLSRTKVCTILFSNLLKGLNASYKNVKAEPAKKAMCGSSTCKL